METLILFDLDGTLTDSGPGIIRCVQYALKKMGQPAPKAEELSCFVGPPLLGTIHGLRRIQPEGGGNRQSGTPGAIQL